MDVRVRHVSWSALSDKEVQVRVDPIILDWPNNFGSIQYTPDTLLLPGWKYLVFQLWLIRSYIDNGTPIDFPEYDRCVKSIEKWGADSLWTLPNLVRNLLHDLFTPTFPYLADWKPRSMATIITLHNEMRTGDMRTPSLKKKIDALEDDKEGFHLLCLYRQRDVRPVFEQSIVSEPFVMLSCRKLAFKNELDAILHQQLVIVEEQETA